MGATYKTIDGPGWQWAEDYVFATANYVVACPPNRRCEVRMGISIFGKPRGEKVEFAGELEIMVVGAGALHFRIVDGQGPCAVAFALKSNRPVSWTWPAG